MSRRTCAATRTVARKASGNFPQRLRVFRFRSALWASRVLGRLARGCDRVSCEGSCGAFLKPSFVGLSSPSSAPGCAVSAPAVPPSAARGYPCTARAFLPSFRHLRISLRHQGLCAPSLASAPHSIGASVVAPVLCVVYRSYTLEGNQEHPVTRAHGAVCVLLYVSGPDQIEQAAVEGFGVHAKTLRRCPRVHATTCGFS